MSEFAARPCQVFSKQWTGQLAHFRGHRNDEHREALVAEAQRFVGLHLEDSLARSHFWAETPLARRVAVLLYLVDRGAVARKLYRGRAVYEVISNAEAVVATQPEMSAYLVPTLELLAAIRDDQGRRSLAAE